MKKAIGMICALTALVLMASGCSVNGTPASMVGKWKVTGGYIYDMYNANWSGIDLTIEITNDDTITVEWSYSGRSGSDDFGKITKCTCNEFYVDDGDEAMQYELTCNSMIWKHDGDTYAEMEKQ